jgi:molybdenum ABC transporter molybdate-binding protein
MGLAATCVGIALSSALLLTSAPSPGHAAPLEIFHADSLAGPMEQLKAAFERANPGVTVALTSGRSQELADRILKGDRCDVFASSSPAVIEQDLMKKTPAGSSKPGASWSVVFSANEMVVITRKGNPLGIQRATDLASPGVRFVRVTGEKDLGTGRTIEFLKRAAAREGAPDLAQRLIDGAAADPSKPTTVPDTVRAVAEGRADAGVVYYSAAVATSQNLDIVRFPADVNLSEAIRNAATVPATAVNVQPALAFVKFLLSPEGRNLLEKAGQPAVFPAIQSGNVPAELN